LGTLTTQCLHRLGLEVGLKHAQAQGQNEKARLRHAHVFFDALKTLRFCHLLHHESERYTCLAEAMRTLFVPEEVTRAASASIGEICDLWGKSEQHEYRVGLSAFT